MKSDSIKQGTKGDEKRCKSEAKKSRERGDFRTVGSVRTPRDLCLSSGVLCAVQNWKKDSVPTRRQGRRNGGGPWFRSATANARPPPRKARKRSIERTPSTIKIMGFCAVAFYRATRQQQGSVLGDDTTTTNDLRRG